MRYPFIHEHRKAWPMRVMCGVLRVARSGYYDWRNRCESQRSVANRKMTVAIKAIHRESRETYGSPRVHAELKRRGLACGPNRVARLMAKEGIRAKTKRKFRHTTDSNHRLAVAENLLDRDFHVQEPNQAWVADITYIWTLQGWLYLATVMDLCSRRIVGWSLEAYLKKELVLAALKMAIHRRGPTKGLLHHSDRGSQYASKAYRKMLENHGLVCSMSRKGDCWDNAPMESFFKTLKTECVYHERFTTRQQAKEVIIEYIEMFYNSKRSHSTLGYTSPLEFERQLPKHAMVA